MKMPPKVKKIWDIATTVLVILVVLCAIFLMGARVVGLQVFNVVSGSMEPTYSTGDLLYVKKADLNDIQVGDVITFVMNENLVVGTHRVVEVDRANGAFITQGDNSDTVDANPVKYENVIGTPVFAIPLLGYVSAYIQSPPGMYVAIAFCVVLVAAVFLPDLLTKKKKLPEGETDNREKESEA